MMNKVPNVSRKTYTLQTNQNLATSTTTQNLFEFGSHDQQSAFLELCTSIETGKPTVFIICDSLSNKKILPCSMQTERTGHSL